MRYRIAQGETSAPVQASCDAAHRHCMQRSRPDDRIGNSVRSWLSCVWPEFFPVYLRSCTLIRRSAGDSWAAVFRDEPFSAVFAGAYSWHLFCYAETTRKLPANCLLTEFSTSYFFLHFPA